MSVNLLLCFFLKKIMDFVVIIIGILFKLRFMYAMPRRPRCILTRRLLISIAPWLALPKRKWKILSKTPFPFLEGRSSWITVMPSFMHCPRDSSLKGCLCEKWHIWRANWWVAAAWAYNLACFRCLLSFWHYQALLDPFVRSPGIRKLTINWQSHRITLSISRHL